MTAEEPKQPKHTHAGPFDQGGYCAACEQQLEAPPVWRWAKVGETSSTEAIVRAGKEYGISVLTPDHANDLEHQHATDQAQLEEAWMLLDRARSHAPLSTWPWPWIADVDALRKKQWRS